MEKNDPSVFFSFKPIFKMKIVKYALIAATFLFVGYNSIEIKPLNEVVRTGQKFDAAAFAHTYLTKTLPPVFPKATLLTDVVSAIATDKNKAFNDLSHAVSIGNIRHFLIKGEGTVSRINEDEVVVLVKNGTQSLTINLATEFIYGSSIRDAAGLFDLKKFTNSTDVNNIAAEINKIIKTTVIPPFKQQVKVGSVVQFIGALELNQEHPQLDNFEILPIELK
jgi:predicted lipoprotein